VGLAKCILFAYYNYVLLLGKNWHTHTHTSYTHTHHVNNGIPFAVVKKNSLLLYYLHRKFHVGSNNVTPICLPHFFDTSTSNCVYYISHTHTMLVVRGGGGVHTIQFGGNFLEMRLFIVLLAGSEN
jgi:hypothetical protein